METIGGTGRSLRKQRRPPVSRRPSRITRACCSGSLAGRGRRRRRGGKRRVLRELRHVNTGELRGLTHWVVELRVDLLHAVPGEQRQELRLAIIGLAVVDERLLHRLAEIGREV